MDHKNQIALQLGIAAAKVSTAIDLLDTDNTIPFIARYRKEATGGLDEEQLRQVQELLNKLRALDERRQTVLKTIEAQGELTPELKEQLHSVNNLTTLEDIYQPFKPKRRTRASIARERGLQNLADLILDQPVLTRPLPEIAKSYLSAEVPNLDDAWAGARDIVAETINDHPGVRGLTRSMAFEWANLLTEKTSKKADQKGVYQTYYEFTQPVNRLLPHQVLAINRGEADKALRVRVQIDEQDWQSAVRTHFRPNPDSPLAEALELAIEDCGHRLLLPAIERDVRRRLTAKAEEHAIQVFATNLRALLNQPPLSGFTVLGIDPGYRTGCKLAVVDATGKVLETGSIHPHVPQRHWAEAKDRLHALVERHEIQLIAIGNGTASRETETLTAELIRETTPKTLQYLIVDEAGASVYSASPLARQELPELDVSLRGAVSIARRAQDPLSELVKIDPRSIGVGLYQHDVDQRKLTASLTGVVESVVNNVGVDLNSASPALLTYVAGIGPKLAERIVTHRDQHGPFSNRRALLEVSGLGPKAFEQAAGFLRIPNGEVPLDNTGVHPESYPVVERLMETMRDTGRSWAQRVTWQALPRLIPEYRGRFGDLQELADWLEVGVYTLADILDELEKPGRDPRQDLPKPILRSDVLSIDDLKPGMQLYGTVRNVVDFGAFLDIGVKRDGLLHRSQIPGAVMLQVGDVIQVRIRQVDVERERISLGWSKEKKT